jgi:hypothetical protein
MKRSLTRDFYYCTLLTKAALKRNQGNQEKAVDRSTGRQVGSPTNAASIDINVVKCKTPVGFGPSPVGVARDYSLGLLCYETKTGATQPERSSATRECFLVDKDYRYAVVSLLLLVCVVWQNEYSTYVRQSLQSWESLLRSHQIGHLFEKCVK